MSSKDWVKRKLLLNFEQVILERNVISIQELFYDSSSFLRILRQGHEIGMLKNIILKLFSITASQSWEDDVECDIIHSWKVS